jgi:hypothetical protein
LGKYAELQTFEKIMNRTCEIKILANKFSLNKT